MLPYLKMRTTISYKSCNARNARMRYILMNNQQGVRWKKIA